MPSYPNRKYVIITTAEVEDIDFNEIQESSVHTLRFSKDGEYTFVKFHSETPSSLTGKDQHTHYEINNILNDTNGIWTMNEEEFLAFIETRDNVINNISWKSNNPFN